MLKANLVARWCLLVCLLVAGSRASWAQTTTFSYQGKLTDAGQPANGVFDLQFKLFDALNAGTQQGTTLTLEDVVVSSGVFTVQLDFGAAFPGAARYLEISVRPGASTGAFTLLTPRQPVQATPYAIRSLLAGTAAQANSLAGCVACVTSDQIGGVNGSTVTGAIPVASVPAGSGNYVQNTTSPQASSNFNISGNGTAGGTLSGNIVNATTQYNLNGLRVLANPGSSNLFAGAGAGIANTTGFSNAFFGSGAGNFNSSGSNNTFFGASAGVTNTSGFNNAYFGSSAGFSSTGNANAFFGFNAGFANTTGGSNAFFGAGAGDSNLTGNFNAFFGIGAGGNTNSGNNTFIGGAAGGANTTGSQNTALGASAEVGTTNTNATAIGSQASAACSNCVVLGSVNGVNGAAGNVRVGIGTTNPSATLEVRDSTANTGRIQVGAPAAGSDEKLVVFGDTDNTSCGGPCVYLGERTVDDRMELRAGSFMFRNGPVTPGADGTQNLGSLTLRWNTLFATNGVINTSDARLKQNVTPMRYGLRELLRLRPVSFEWKGTHDGRTHLGLLAQEAETVIPEAVVRDADPAATLGMSYTDLIPVVIKSIQEQQTVLAQKEQAIKALETQNAALLKRLELVEQALVPKQRAARRTARLRQPARP